MNETELRDKIASIAEDDARALDIYEWSSRLNELIELYNNFPNIGRGIKYAPSLGGWCMLYVSSVFIRCGLAETIQPEIGAYEPMKDAKAGGYWKDRTSGYIPRRGDIVHYAFPRTDEKGRTYTQYHVGIITNADNNVIYSTEGNVESRVLMRACFDWKNNKDIDGFIVPQYEKAVDVLELPPLPNEHGEFYLCAVLGPTENKIEWKKEK